MKDNPVSLLEMLKDWKAGSLKVDDYYGIIWAAAHTLAEAKYEPAKDLFILGLEDTDWVWRENCVSFLGFHYPLDYGILTKIRELLMEDPISDVRITAASVLGGRSTLPDFALYKSVTFDTNLIVRRSAYNSILQLAGVSYEVIQKELREVRKGKIEPSLDRVKQLLKAENIAYQQNFFDSEK